MPKLYPTSQHFAARAFWMLWAFLLVGVLVPGCVEKELSIELPDLKQNPLAVLAVLDNGRPPSVLLSRVEQLDNEGVYYPITNALVVVYEDDRPIDTLINLVDYIQVVDPLSNSIYYSDDALNFRDGSSYHLTVQAEGYSTAVSEHLIYRRVIAPDVQLDKVVTDSTEFGPIGNITFTFETTLEFNEGEFLVQQETSEATRANYDGTLYTEEQIVNNIRLSRINQYPFLVSEYRSAIGVDLPQGTYTETLQDTYLDLPLQRVSISVTNYSRHYLSFAEAITQQDRENVGGLGTLAQQLPTNIQGGYGYFTIRDNQTIFLN